MGEQWYSAFKTLVKWEKIYVFYQRQFILLSLFLLFDSIFSMFNGTSVFFFIRLFQFYHVYCNLILGCMYQIFGALKDRSLLINMFALNNCFSYRDIFENGVNTLSKLDDAFLTKT